MGLASNIQTKLEQYADTSGDIDLRVSIGAPGYTIQVRNESVLTGAAYGTPAFLSGLIHAIGAVLDTLPNAGAWKEEEFSVTALQTSFVLTLAPLAAAGMLSGYVLHIFKAGVRMRYAASPVESLDYSFVLGTKTVSVTAPGFTTRYHAVYLPAT